MMNRGITPYQAKRFYDRFGAKQDSQGWYEDRAVERMIELGRFGEAHRVFELGFGTGRLAQRLLRDHVPSQCEYVGQEVSETMHRLASDRLAPWDDRVDLHIVDPHLAEAAQHGFPDIDAPDSMFDRCIATYVIDLMNLDDISHLFAEAHRVLRPDGLLCLVSLTHGPGLFSGAVSWLWERIQAIAPERVGGCRPVSPSALLRESGDAWNIAHSDIICRFGVCSEVCIAKRGNHAP